MSRVTVTPTRDAIIGEPEVVEDIVGLPAWRRLKSAVSSLRTHQVKDGSIPDATMHGDCRAMIATIRADVRELASHFPHDADYLTALDADFARWAEGGFGEPDFLDSLVAFQPQRDRVDGMRHLVVFPMYTQNGSSDRRVEAVLIEVIWPEFIADLDANRVVIRVDGIEKSVLRVNHPAETMTHLMVMTGAGETNVEIDELIVRDLTQGLPTLRSIRSKQALT